MTDAEATIKHAIFDGLIDQWHRKNHPNFAEILKDKVFDALFAPHYRWAIEEYLEELKKQL